MTFKCKMCGGNIEIEGNARSGECSYCGSLQTFPVVTDDKRRNLHDRANHYRLTNEFDKSAGLYEQLINEDGTDAEAYWSLLLCQYGIEYVEDTKTGKRVPTIHRMQYDSILSDYNYTSALKYAEPEQKAIYEEEAKAIDSLQKEIFRISQKEQPYDVFISYKEKDKNGDRTRDSVDAASLYSELLKEGIRAFYAPVALEDKIGEEYEPYIFAALNSAKVMVVLGSKKEYFEAPWVKNEWSRYLALIKAGQKKTLIPAFKDMDPYDLPEEFSHLQAQDMTKIAFMSDLVRGIKKLLGRSEKQVTKQTDQVSNDLKRAFDYLSMGEWNEAEKFLEKVLNVDAENAEAYLGKILLERHLNRKEDLKDCKEPFKDNKYFRVFMQYAAGTELGNEINGYLEYIAKRNENSRKQSIYEDALKKMGNAKDEKTYLLVAHLFNEIHGFMDADELAERCEKKANDIRNTETYNRAVALFNHNVIKDYEAAKEIFASIPNWADSESKINLCVEKIDELKRKEEQRQKKIAEKKRATRKIRIILALALAGTVAFFIFKKKMLDPANSLKNALDLMEQGNYSNAEAELKSLEGFGTSRERLQVIAAINDIPFDTLVNTINKILRTGEQVEIEYFYQGQKDTENSCVYKEGIILEEDLWEPDRLGYQFLGWSVDSFSYNRDAGLKICLADNWSDKYAITYELKEGTSSNPTEYSYTGNDIILKVPKRDGFVFDGWTGTDLATKTLEVKIPSGSFGDRHYIANWVPITYTVSFNIDGAEKQPDSIKVSCDEKVTLPKLTKDNYAFVGWFSGEKKIEDGIWDIAADTTLVAKWEPKVYRITYELAEGTNSSENPFEYTIESKAIKLANPTKVGSSFSGWYTEKEYKNKITEIKAETASDVTLYAKWKATTYKITLDANGGNVSKTSVSTKYNEQYTLPTPTRKGYTFEGWYIGKEKYESGVWTQTQGITLTAKWSVKQYKISYKLDGGENASDNPTKYTADLGMIEIKRPTKKGYTFKGWYTDKDFTQKLDSLNAETAADITLYALWTLTNYSITYDLNSGQLVGKAVYDYTIEDLPLTLPDAKKSTLLFLGWNVNDSNGECISEITEAGNYYLIGSYMDAELKLTLSKDQTYYIVSEYTGSAMQVEIPSHYKGKPVKEISAYAFGDRRNSVHPTLVKVIIPDTVTKIGEYAFANCRSLTTVNIPEDLEIIPDYAFYYCERLKEISVPESTWKIGKYSFAYCNTLRTVSWPYIVLEIGEYAFYKCSALNINAIPDGVSIINRYSFAECKSIRSLNITSTVEEIAAYAFDGCSGLNQVVIPEGIGKISSYSFVNCTAVKFYCCDNLPGDYWDSGWNQKRPVQYGYDAY